MSNKKVYWANLRDGANQQAYIELDQISRGRWKVPIDVNEFIIKTTSSDPLEILNQALSHHLLQSQ